MYRSRKAATKEKRSASNEFKETTNGEAAARPQPKRREGLPTNSRKQRMGKPKAFKENKKLNCNRVRVPEALWYRSSH
jgi:hypothetical protein